MVMSTVLKKLLPFAFSSRSKHPVEDEARKMAMMTQQKYKKPTKKIKNSKKKNKAIKEANVEIIEPETKVPIDYKAPNNDPLYIAAIDEAIRYKLIYLGEKPDISTIGTIGKIITQYQKSNNPYRQHYDNSLHIVRNPSTDSDNSNNEVIDKQNETQADISNGVSISNVKERKTSKRNNLKNRNTMIEPFLLHNKNLEINNEQEDTIDFITKRSTNSNISSDKKHTTKQTYPRSKNKSKSKSSRLDKYKINRMITQTNTESIMKGMYINVIIVFLLTICLFGY